MRKYIALFAAVTLAACGGGTGGTGGNTTAVAPPVTSVAPPAGKQWSDVVEKTAEGYRMGNPNAPVKLVEYGARLCPGCKAFALEGFQPLITKYVSTGKVSFEFRDFIIHGPPELAFAAMGQCGGPEPFFPILEQAYIAQDDFNRKIQSMPPEQQQAFQALPPAQALVAWAEATGELDFVKQRGIPDAKAKACMADQKVIEAIAKVTEKAGSDGTVSSTPTLIVNGNNLGSVGWPEVEQALKNAGAR